VPAAAEEPAASEPAPETDAPETGTEPEEPEEK